MSTQEINGKHADLCASYQEAAIDQLAKKCGKFLQGIHTRVLLSGGVANNQLLHDRLRLCSYQDIQFLAVAKKHAGDNASMIAHAAHLDHDGLWGNDQGRLNFNPGLTLDALPVK